MILVTCNDCLFVEKRDEEFIDPFYEYHCSQKDCNSLDVEIEEVGDYDDETPVQ